MQLEESEDAVDGEDDETDGPEVGAEGVIEEEGEEHGEGEGA